MPDSIRNRMRLERHPAVSITPATLIEWLWRFKHPGIITLGINCNRHGARARNAAGLDPHGTMWWEAPLGDMQIGEAIPCNVIPYDSRTTATFNEDRARWEGGELMRGWRRFLLTLTKGGVLHPCDELSYLLGENSYAECPREYWT